jgi:hypothetical protein
MRLKPGQLFFFAPLLFVTAVQAAPYGPPNPAVEGQVAPAYAPKPHSSADPQPGKSTSVKGNARSGSRYGIGYEARHGMDAGGRDDRGGRMERPERLERIERPERPERAERDDRGR